MAEEEQSSQDSWSTLYCLVTNDTVANQSQTCGQLSILTARAEKRRVEVSALPLFFSYRT